MARATTTLTGARHIGSYRPERLHFLRQALGQDRLWRRPDVGRPPGQHLEEHAADGVHVGAGVHRGSAHRLLGAHVLRRSDGQAGPGQARLIPQGPGDAEVRHQGMAFAQHDVGRLDVPMDDAPPVGVGQRLGHFPGEPHRFVHRQLSVALKAFAEGLALDVGHHVVEDPPGLARVVHRQDMRMGELGGDLDFTQKPLGAQRGGQLRAHDLHRHLAVVPQVLRQVDRGHPALAQHPLHPVAVGQRLDGRGPPRRSRSPPCAAEHRGRSGSRGRTAGRTAPAPAAGSGRRGSCGCQ